MVNQLPMNTKCNVCSSVYFELVAPSPLNECEDAIYTIQCTQCKCVMMTINKTRLVNDIARRVDVALKNERVEHLQG